MNYINFQILGFISILIVVFIGYKIVINLIETENNKKLNDLIQIFSVIFLWFLIYNLFKTSKLTNEETIPLSIIVTLIMWLANLNIFEKDISKKYRAKKTNIEAHPYLYKQAYQFSSKDIPLYVRFTMCEITDLGKNLIFDSSDFYVINKAFGTFNGIEQTLKKGKNFNINGIEYSVLEVDVCMVRLFDDYIGGHSKVYQGNDTPYNIQIIANLKIK